jgi:uncharacterized protein
VNMARAEGRGQRARDERRRTPWRRCPLPFALCPLVVAVLAAVTLGASAPDAALPELTQPVNDFAKVIDAANSASIDQMIRTLKAATGDVVVVATVPDIDGYGDIQEYANKLFGNHGRGIGEKGKDNGLLILLALKERKVWIEVGYSLEQWITDGFSGETSRTYMVPAFRSGQYGAGLRAGAERIIGRIAQGRGVTLQGVRVPREQPRQTGGAIPFWVMFLVFIIISLIVSRIGGGPGSSLRRGGWSGWSSGVGPFGGGWGGGGFGGGGGGGFGGFGGGSSGGGGGGASW